MHDWGDMLVRAGFAEPVMDMERITLTFSSPVRLIEELRTLGRNLFPGRFQGLRGRQWKAALEAALAQRQGEGVLSLTFEVIYGHALRPAPRLPVSGGVSVEGLREELRKVKAGRPNS